MPISSLQLEFGLAVWELSPSGPPSSALHRKRDLFFVHGLPENGERGTNLWKCQSSSGEEGTVAEGLQEPSDPTNRRGIAEGLQEPSDPTNWRGNRGIMQIPRHPDSGNRKSKDALRVDNRQTLAWVDSRPVEWDAGRRRHPRSASTSVQAGNEEEGQIAMCRNLCEVGRVTQAVEVLNLLVERGCHVSNNLFYCALKRCIAQKDLVLGRHIHALTIKSGYEGDAFLATHLIGLYASHGRLQEAILVFSKVAHPSAHNWASIIFAHARHGEPKNAIVLYQQMRESGVKADNRIFVAVLKACASARDLAAIKDVHAHILATGGDPDMFVQTCLVDAYAKCGNLDNARRVFDTLSHKNVVTWTAMIAGYAQQGMGQEALTLYSSMQQEGITPPDSVTFVCLLQACASVGAVALQQGKQLHSQIRERRLQDDVAVGASLVNMYAKCRSLEDARIVFDKLPQKTTVTWTTMIAGYAQQGVGQEALSLYSSMQEHCSVQPSCVTFTCLLQACASSGVSSLQEGKQLHAQVEELGFQDDVAVGGSLVNMYAKCGSLKDARRVFDRLPQKNLVTWTTMIAGYAQQGMGKDALSLYSSMLQEGITAPDSITFISLLQACASVGAEALQQGKKLHAQLEELGLQYDVAVGGSLVNMYAKCGCTANAQRVFDRLSHKNVVTWTAMIAGYVQQGMGQEALDLYTSMQREGLTPPDSVTFVCLLQACSCVGAAALHQGKELHAQIDQQGLQDDVVVGSSLVNMYAKCRSVENAQKEFDRLSVKNVVTWNAMIAGYVQQGMPQEALDLYTSMQEEGITSPDSVTYVSLLHACATVSALPLGKQFHAQIEERGLQAEEGVGSSLVNMYAKCGSVEDAQEVFDALAVRDIVAWSALIAGYSGKGDSEAVFALVDRMQQEGTQPNSITFLSVLTVCSYVGLVDKGRNYFEAMSNHDGIMPTVKHYTCMMDLLGRAGHLAEALQMAKTMPVKPNVAVWLTLLAACRKWSNVEVGQQAFQFAVSLDEQDATSYVLMSNIYADAEMWEEAKEMQARRKKFRAWKQPGQTRWTDMRGVMHTFSAGDKTHADQLTVQLSSVPSD